MKSYLLYTSTILLLTSFCIIQDNCFYWHERDVLTWDDFTTVKKGALKHEAAHVHVGIVSNVKYRNDTLTFEVKTCSDPTKSVVVEGKQTDYILSHEQRHFDIQEIYSRKYRKQLSEYDFCLKTLQKDVQKLYKKVFVECTKEQALYDKQTSHSINKEKQEEWNQKIDKQLKALKKHSETTIKIKL